MFLLQLRFSRYAASYLPWCFPKQCGKSSPTVLRGAKAAEPICKEGRQDRRHGDLGRGSLRSPIGPFLGACRNSLVSYSSALELDPSDPEGFGFLFFGEVGAEMPSGID